MAKKPPAPKLVEAAKKTSKPRLTDDAKFAIFERMMSGEPQVKLAKELSLSMGTLGAIKKKYMGGGAPAEMPAGKESPLRASIYMFGFRILMGEEVSESEIADLKEQIAQKQKDLMRQLALAI